MPQVSVLIVNWNGAQLLARCLPSVMAQTWTDAEVVVWDNGSTDGSAAWVEAHYPAVRVLRGDRNLGFAGGNNAAIRATQSSYVATLNNDAEPDPTWLSSLMGAIESVPDVGMCASKMVRAEDPSIMDACGIEVDRAGIAWNRCNGEPEGREETAPYEVFGPCAGAALYRREMLDQVGAFDEDYFAYYEDVDLAWRARRAGWRCLYVPQARVTHRHSSTGREGSPFKGYHIGRNKVWTLIKNYPWPDWLVHLPAIVGCDVAAWGYAFLHGDIHPLRGRVAALRQWGRFAAKRRRIQSAGRPVALAPVGGILRRLRVHRRRTQSEVGGCPD
jgi:GT2 family glycosyltransferase